MPYIEQADRIAIDDGRSPLTAGELNYKITMKMIRTGGGVPVKEIEADLEEYLSRGPLSYTRLNEIVGVLTCAAMEMLRRAKGDVPFRIASAMLAISRKFYDKHAVPYEDAKRQANGDISYDFATRPDASK